MTIEDWLGNENELGCTIWNTKYRQNNETFDDWVNRISNFDKDVKKLILEKKFLFGGRILSNRGLKDNCTYSNCYVVESPEDNLESIFECVSKIARTFSYGGGVGVNLGKLRPTGAKVNNSAKVTSGATSFIDLFSKVTEVVGQNGRRGALMIALPCNHPDLEDFIRLKSDLDRGTKANLSIMITNDFMNCVINKKDYELKFIVESTKEVISKTVNAYELFETFCKMNWGYAEPGMLFWDRIENYNMLSEYDNFKFECVNPCAEEPLPAGGSCLLGSINLAEFVKNDQFDFVEFGKTIHVCIRALNDVLDEGLEKHPLEEQRQSVRDWRQIGLGIMGLADMLIKLRIPYGSLESIELCKRIAKLMICDSMLQSSIIAKDKGSFKHYDYEKLTKSTFYQNIMLEFTEHEEEYMNCGMRNSQLLTIAPTGTLSTMLGISGGIEPIFDLAYTRKTQSLHNEDVEYKIFTPIVKQYLQINNLELDEKNVPDYFVTSKNLNYKQRIDMQAIWQKYIDASISSTVNVKEETTVDEIKNLYIYAYEKGLKGVTIYRDNCKRSGILTTTKEKSDISTELKRGEVVKNHDDVTGYSRTLMTGCGTMHFSAFFDNETNELSKVFVSKGSEGGCNNNMIGVSRLISVASRSGTPIDEIIEQLLSCGTCHSYCARKKQKNDTSKGTSCPVAIGHALIDICNSRNNIKTKETTKSILKCPECDQDLTFENGCNSCKHCGYSKCD